MAKTSYMYGGCVVDVQWDEKELNIIWQVSRSYGYEYKFTASGIKKYTYQMKLKHTAPPFYGTTVVPRYTKHDIELLSYISDKLLQDHGITIEFPKSAEPIVTPIRPQPSVPKPEPVFPTEPVPTPPAPPKPKPIAESEKKKDNTILWLIFGALLVFIFMKKR